MKYKYWSRQKKTNFKNAWTGFIVIIAFFALAIYREDLAPATKMISPIPNKVQAKEVKITPKPPTDEEIFAYAVKVWGKEGKDILIKMFNCFYSESGWNYKAVNVNKNSTKDAGIAQINDIHGMSLQDRLDYKKNIDKAYQIYLGRGRSFNAWYGSACY